MKFSLPALALLLVLAHGLNVTVMPPEFAQFSHLVAGVGPGRGMAGFRYPDSWQFSAELTNQDGRSFYVESLSSSANAYKTTQFMKNPMARKLTVVLDFGLSAIFLVDEQVQACAAFRIQLPADLNVGEFRQRAWDESARDLGKRGEGWQLFAVADHATGDHSHYFVDSDGIARFIQGARLQGESMLPYTYRVVSPLAETHFEDSEFRYECCFKKSAEEWPLLDINI